MTDNSDLLGGGKTLLPGSEAEPVPAKKPRGRPRKTPAAAAPAAPPATLKPTTLADITAAGEGPPNVVPSSENAAPTVDATAETRPTEAVAPTNFTAEEVAQKLLDAKEAKTVAEALAKLDQEAADRKAALAANPDAPIVALPVSTEYAAEQAKRITLIGTPKREYAYQRLMRHGKRL